MAVTAAAPEASSGHCKPTMESAAEQQQNSFKDRDGTRVVAAAAATVETLVNAELEQDKSRFVLPEVSLLDRHADEPCHLRVTVIGAGIAGIVAGALLLAKVPGIELTIFEKNADVVGSAPSPPPPQCAFNSRLLTDEEKGGVWFENVYPGVCCNVPAHVYRTSFAPNTQWSEEYAQGPELLDYWAGVARKYDVYKYLKVSHEVKDLQWDNEKSVWLVKVCNVQSREVRIHEADFVLTAIGRLNDWRLSDYPGINDFRDISDTRRTGTRHMMSREREWQSLATGRLSPGANVDVLPPFGITANGKSIAQLWSPDGEYGFPYSYLGYATPGFPNLGFIQGPNGAGRSGTVPHNVEVQATYFAKILRKVGRERIKTMQPSKKAANDFVQYSDAFFKKTVMSECKSWYNTERPGSRIHGLWPGSAALVGLVVNDPRWKDWEYEYLSDTENSLLGYFGNGCTKF
ncbi:4-hydroxyacetophenone monooxygenase [Colletotrichum tofieldiae]|nr:4-hydroxyacetophenone monooxygenase [Colletotrichum tofieldiae]GKT74641.1 4-hydroxyacetophenone monooxygenase [Colletotrichum tofieldiae]